MIFKDDTCLTLDAQIYRRELDPIVSFVKHRIRKIKEEVE